MRGYKFCCDFRYLLILAAVAFIYIQMRLFATQSEYADRLAAAIEAENHCTSQTRLLIDQISQQQGRIVALEEQMKRQDQECRQLRALVQDLESKGIKKLIGNVQMPVAAVVVMACNRADYLEKTIKSILKYQISVAPKYPLFISQDGSHPDVRKLALSYDQLTYMQHLDFEPVHTERPGELIAYYKIARHYKWALDQLFYKHNFSRVIILEDDMEIAPDFFDFFEAGATLLDRDKSIMAISSWNDNGQMQFVQDPYALYRSDFFPGLGWMLSKSTWDELSPKWPKAYWDDWLRLKENHRGRQFIRPEVCRSYNFGEHGSSLGQFFKQYLEPIKLNDVQVDWKSMDLSYLLGELQAKENMVFAGTTVVNGSCICIVVDTGMCTEIGKIQRQIHDASMEENDTPLKKKLDEFGNRLTSAIGIVCLVVWAINYRYFLTWKVVDGWPSDVRFSFEKCTYYFKIAVTLAVAAIPEGLPAVITTCLALGTRKMAQKNAIVRKLPSVETLGCTTVICSDKTGTLTTNQMSVTEFFTLGGKTTTWRTFSVEGTTYDPKDGRIIDWNCYNMDANLLVMAEICAICNDAGVFCDGRLFKATGLPTEAALKVLVEKMGVPDSKARSKIRDAQIVSSYLIDRNTVKLGCCEWWMKRSKRVAALEFDRVRKSMGVIVRELNGSNRLLVKGAVESLLERSTYVQLADGSTVPIDESCRQLLLLRHLQMSSKGLRCLGLAYKDDLGELSGYYAETHPAHKKLLDPSCYSSIESDLVFVGVVGLRDPPREEVHKAVNDCRRAGIKIMVITGDNKSTAEAVCREIQLFSDGENLRGSSFTGKEFMALSSQQQIEILSKDGGKVFSRAEPRHKQEIVRMLKEMGEVVAMTGDGVNDAPALKLADIGIAMGITGTEVAKEASDMVLADDNFSTIVSAVAEGRSIYNNMKAFIRYMISSNVGEVISIFLTAALGIPECLIAVQLLWVNLVTDGPPATALGFNPADVDIMQKPPRKSNDALINSWVFFRYMVIGSYVGIATVGIFIVWYTQASFLGIDLVSDGHTLVELSQLRNWGECSAWPNFTVSPFTAGNRLITFSHPCDYFSVGKVKAMTLSLSVLVAIEMFNSLNALSEDNSLIKMPPWRNPWLLVAMSVSFGLHCLILYTPFLADIFGIVPLSRSEWLLVILLSAPVILIDEVLKFVGRRRRWRSKLKAA